MITITSRQSGLTIIEVMITMIIMSVGLLGLASVQSTAVKDGLDIAKQSQATWLITELVERMRANPDPANDDSFSQYEGTLDVAACGGAAANACGDVDGTNATACTVAEIAQYDVWEVFCGHPASAAGVLTNAADSLELTQVDITCADAACNSPDDDFIITLSWQMKGTGSADFNTALTATAANNVVQNIRMQVRP